MKKVIYRMNEKGEFPGKYLKGFVPSQYMLPGNFYAGQTPLMMEEFAMVELTDAEFDGLRLFNLVDGVPSKWEVSGAALETKAPIVFTDLDAQKQLVTKRRIAEIMINFDMDTEIKGLFSGLSQEEIKTWTTQKIEAQTFINTGDAGQATFIAALAEARGEDLTEFANKIIEKATTIESQTVAIMAKCQGLRKTAETADNATLNEILGVEL